MSAARSRRANDKHNHLQRTPILVMGCSLLIACCIAFGGTNWTASAQPSEDQLPEQNAIVEPGYYQETIGSYEAISQSDDDERAENLRLAAEAINGYVIEPGATFSFNEVVGDTTAERGYKEAPVLYSVCTRPCFAGCETDAVAAAFGAEPIPASLENRPRLIPNIKADPANPPNIA